MRARIRRLTLVLLVCMLPFVLVNCGKSDGGDGSKSPAEVCRDACDYEAECPDSFDWGGDGPGFECEDYCDRVAEVNSDRCDDAAVELFECISDLTCNELQGENVCDDEFDTFLTDSVCGEPEEDRSRLELCADACEHRDACVGATSPFGCLDSNCSGIDRFVGEGCDDALMTYNNCRLEAACDEYDVDAPVSGPPCVDERAQIQVVCTDPLSL